MRQPVYQVSCTRYQVSFYLRWIGLVLKYFKVPKYYDQNCTISTGNVFNNHKVFVTIVALIISCLHIKERLSSTEKYRFSTILSLTVEILNGNFTLAKSTKKIKWFSFTCFYKCRVDLTFSNLNGCSFNEYILSKIIWS